MVLRRLYFSIAHNSQLQLIPWLVERQLSVGLFKAVRQRHRRNTARSLEIWTEALTLHQWESADGRLKIEGWFKTAKHPFGLHRLFHILFSLHNFYKKLK